MSDTPGSILKKARESKKYNIAQAVKGTRIRAVYLQALEADDYSKLPSSAQLRGFLRNYSEFLELDSDDLLNMLPTQWRSIKQIESESSITDTKQFDEPQEMEPTKSERQFLPETIRKNDIENFDQVPITSDKIETNHESKTPPYEDGYQPEKHERKSDTIFLSIGNKLKDQRELLDISLQEVEANTRILYRYLEAIEGGQFYNLETTIQTRGMLSNYSKFLNLDVDEILLQYAEGLQVQLEETLSGKDDSIKKNKFGNRTISYLKRLLTLDLVIGSISIILFLIFIVWGIGKVIDQYNEPKVQATSASISDVILTPLMSSQEALSPDNQITLESTIAATTDATQSSGTQVFQQGQVQIHLVVLQRTWVRVTVDGVVKLENRVEPGSAFPFTGFEQIEILTGNGAALEVIHNQINLGLMGEFGQVVNVIYTPSTILLPTASITPTATITPTPTITPIPSRTLNP